jgi:hypothetical protein
MNRVLTTLTAVAAGGLVAAAAFGPSRAGAAPAAGPTLGPVTMADCATASGHEARCFAEYRAVHYAAGARAATAPPPGLSPADIASAYALPAAGGAGRTVAVVDAFDNPNAEADLATYRTTYGLPPCTTANGCFHKVNQDGATGPYPDPDPQWSVEISLDLDAASAACPLCAIMLVEADRPDLASLGTAEDTAVRLGATAVSNSYDSGWLVAGGTSLSSPLIAAMITRSGHQIDGASHIYAHAAELYDPVGGSNGYCGNDYLCTGKKGYDAPTGAGSPNGLNAF